MHQSIVWAGLPALALVLGGCSDLVERDERPVWAREETIEALGRAYIDVYPNNAVFVVQYRGRAESPELATTLAIARLNLAREAISTISDTGTTVLSQIGVDPYYEQVTRRTGEFTEDLVENIHPSALRGYVAWATLEVITSDLENVDLMRGAAMALGPAQADDVEFMLRPEVETSRRAFDAAVADATARAEIVAQRSGNSLGKLLLLREGLTSCLGREYTSPAVDSTRSDQIVVTGSRIARTPQSELISPLTVTDENLLAGNIEISSVLLAAEHLSLPSEYASERVESRVCAIFAVD